MASNYPDGITDSMIPGVELLEATMRTYRKSCGGGHYDEYEQWQCPVCGAKNDEYGDFESIDDYECWNCNSLVVVTYRRMSRKNY